MKLQKVSTLHLIFLPYFKILKINKCLIIFVFYSFHVSFEK
jgi:hypothetical protein